MKIETSWFTVGMTHRCNVRVQIIYKKNNISAEAAKFSGSNSTFSVLTHNLFPGMDSITSVFKILARTLTLISCIVTTCM